MPKRPSISRRDLLKFTQASPGSLEDASIPDLEASVSTDQMVGRRALMGSYFEIRLGARVPGASGLINSALDKIADLEDQLSVYREDSEVSQINRTAHLGPVPVEQGLFNLLVVAERIHRETHGAYDVAAGALSIAWGFFKGPKRVPTDAELAAALESTGTDKLRFDPETKTIQFDRPGIVINLGGIGKGWAIDQAVKVVREHFWLTGALVHGGRSSAYALGSPPGRFADRWEVALQNPLDKRRPLGLLKLRNRGLGTSGTQFQSFEIDGKAYGHIIDPRTGIPAAGARQVTVLAPTAAEADALSTAFYLLGVERSREYLAAHPSTAALFVEVNGKGRCKVVAMGLDSLDYEKAPTSRWEIARVS